MNLSNANDDGIDWTRLVRAGETRFPEDIDIKAVLKLESDARIYMYDREWCAELLDVFVGLVGPPHIGVFLCKFRVSDSDKISSTWVIVGDVPPAHVGDPSVRNAYQALNFYICEVLLQIDMRLRGLDPVERELEVDIPKEPRFLNVLRNNLNTLKSLYIKPASHLI